MIKKKYLMAAVALICMTLTFVMSSCKKEYDERNYVISYKATSTVTAKDPNKADLTSKFAESDYQNAISKIVTLGSTEDKDAEIIAACDKIYQSHKEKNVNWKGDIIITKYVGLHAETGTVIKTYTFE